MGYVRRMKRVAAAQPGLIAKGFQHLDDEEEEEATGAASSSAPSGGEAAKRARTAADASVGGAANVDWMGTMSALEGLSSPEPDEEDADNTSSAAAASSNIPPCGKLELLKSGTALRVLVDGAEVVAACKEAGLDEEIYEEAWRAATGKVVHAVEVDAENVQVQCRVPGPPKRDIWFSAHALMRGPVSQSLKGPLPPLDRENEQQASASAAASSASSSRAGTASSAGGAASSVPTSEPAVSSAAADVEPPKAAPAEPPKKLDAAELVSEKDVKKYKSADDLLAKVSAEALKQSLQQLGLKCGGKPEDRAKRLFLLKTCPLSELPKKEFAAAK